MTQLTDDEVAEVAKEIQAALDVGDMATVMRLVTEAGEENLARVAELVTPPE